MVGSLAFPVRSSCPQGITNLTTGLSSLQPAMRTKEPFADTDSRHGKRVSWPPVIATWFTLP